MLGESSCFMAAPLERRIGAARMHRKGEGPASRRGLRILEPSAGIEPALSSLPKTCFTTKLRRRPDGGPYVRIRRYHTLGHSGNAELRRPTDLPHLAVSRRLEAQMAAASNLRDRNEGDGSAVRHEDSEVLDLAVVSPHRCTAVVMRAVTVEHDHPLRRRPVLICTRSKRPSRSITTSQR
jgi:hypothetical protein